MWQVSHRARAARRASEAISHARPVPTDVTADAAVSEGVANVRRVSVTDRPAPPAPRAETAGAPGFVQDALLGADGSVDGGDPHELPLHRTTFVVVDLETTGGSPDGGGITEIGAVKVRGGVELGSLGT